MWNHQKHKNTNLKIKPLTRSTQVKHTKHKRIETSIQVATCDPDGGGGGGGKKRREKKEEIMNKMQNNIYINIYTIMWLATKYLTTYC